MVAVGNAAEFILLTIDKNIKKRSRDIDKNIKKSIRGTESDIDRRIGRKRENILGVICFPKEDNL